MSRLAQTLTNKRNRSPLAQARFEFQRTLSLDQRRTASRQLIKTHPDRVPVILERSSHSHHLPKPPKSKFLVPHETTVGKFLFEVRKQIDLGAEEALFLFVGHGVLAPTAAIFSQIYERFHDEDGFLYITYANENTFGASRK